MAEDSLSFLTEVPVESSCGGESLVSSSGSAVGKPSECLLISREERREEIALPTHADWGREVGRRGGEYGTSYL